MEADEAPMLVIACRFVPYDQWLVTHLSTSWRIKQVKLWLLSKCNLAAHIDVSDIDLPRYRPISPITFASVTKANVIDPNDDSEEFADYDGDSDGLSGYESLDFSYGSHKIRPRTAGSHTLRSSISNVDIRAQQQRDESAKQLSTRYTLLTFSTGHILEDEFLLSWYNLRPYELLELHLAGAVVSLPREVMLDYVKPYFVAKVKALRKEGDVLYEGSIRIPQGNKGQTYLSDPPVRKKGRIKLEWKERWVIIHQGVLNLCKHRTDQNPIQRISLSSISALRGAEHLSRLASIVADPRIVCARFRPMQTNANTLPRSAPSSPVEEHRKTNRSARIGDERNGTERHSGDSAHDDTEWIIMDLLDDNAFTSILRIFHRHSPQSISSSFLPAPSTLASNTPTPTTPFASTATITSSESNTIQEPSLVTMGALPYPEWRLNLVNKAHKAGMGDVGLAMDWVLRGDSSISCPTAEERGLIDESDGEESSDVEWRGWMRDLERQAQTRQHDASQRRRVASFGVIPSSPIPSSPDSESPFLFPFQPTFTSPSKFSGSADRLASHHDHRHAFAQRPRSSLSAEDMYLVPSLHGGRMTTTITSTVSVGTDTTSTRRRSSTVTAGMSSRLRKKKDKGKEKDSEDPGTKGSESPKSTLQPKPKLSLIFSDRQSPLYSSAPDPLEHSGSVASAATGNSGQHSRKTSILKHVRSGSSLYKKREETEFSSPVKEEDLTGGGKRRLGLVKGVSAQAERLARGLDSAVDFVDGRVGSGIA